MVVKDTQLPPVFADEKPQIQFTVPLRNETSLPVKFVEVHPSCGCFSVKVGSLELQPGAETSIQFDVDIRLRFGPQRFACYLTLADGSKWTYSVETTIYRRVEFGDRGAQHFGMFDPKGTTEREIELRFFGKDQAALPSVRSVTTNSNHLTSLAGMGKVERNSDEIYVKRVPIKLRLSAGTAAGPFQATISARYEMDGKQQSLETAVSWYVRALFAVSPPTVFFGASGDGQKISTERTVTIRREDGQPLTIKSVKVSCPGVTCVTKPGEAGTVSATFKLDPAAFKGTLYGEAVFETDHPVQSLLTVHVAAVGPGH